MCQGLFQWDRGPWNTRPRGRELSPPELICSRDLYNNIIILIYLYSILVYIATLFISNDLIATSTMEYFTQDGRVWCRYKSCIHTTRMQFCEIGLHRETCGKRCACAQPIQLHTTIHSYNNNSIIVSTLHVNRNKIHEIFP